MPPTLNPFQQHVVSGADCTAALAEAMGIVARSLEDADEEWMDELARLIIKWEKKVSFQNIYEAAVEIKAHAARR